MPALLLVDGSLPALPARLHLTRLLLEFSLHVPALDVLSTLREEDSLLVEGAYLEGWALYLRAEALMSDLTLSRGMEDEESEMTVDEYYAAAMSALIECGRLFAEQDYPDEGISGHVKELLEILEKKGVKPAILEEDEGVDQEVNGTGEGEEWEEERDGEGEGDADVEMN